MFHCTLYMFVAVAVHMYKLHNRIIIIYSTSLTHVRGERKKGVRGRRERGREGGWEVGANG